MAAKLEPGAREKLRNLYLDQGGHTSPEDGMCVMEAIAWIQGRRFNDSPACVHPWVRDLAIDVNDAVDYEERQHLIPLIPRMVGTALNKRDDARLQYRLRVLAAKQCLKRMTVEGGTTRLRQAARVAVEAMERRARPARRAALTQEFQREFMYNGDLDSETDEACEVLLSMLKETGDPSRAFRSSMSEEDDDLAVDDLARFLKVFHKARREAGIA